MHALAHIQEMLAVKRIRGKVTRTRICFRCVDVSEPKVGIAGGGGGGYERRIRNIFT